jgi:4-aminobutyrate aminotransferase-like enzyme
VPSLIARMDASYTHGASYHPCSPSKLRVGVMSSHNHQLAGRARHGQYNTSEALRGAVQVYAAISETRGAGATQRVELQRSMTMPMPKGPRTRDSGEPKKF